MEPGAAAMISAHATKLFPLSPTPIHQSPISGGELDLSRVVGPQAAVACRAKYQAAATALSVSSTSH